MKNHIERLSAVLHGLLKITSEAVQWCAACLRIGLVCR